MISGANNFFGYCLAHQRPKYVHGNDYKNYSNNL